MFCRHKLHNAATLAGMAIGNASVGVNHALAHALGARFNVPHGRANAVFLLSTIEYNAHIPAKFVSIPCYPLWIADRKYARAAQFVGLKDPEGGSGENDEASRARLILELRRAIYDLGRLAKIPLAISELGISQSDLEAAMPELVATAFDDMSVRTNPSYALAPEIVQLFISSFPPRQRP